MERRTFMAVVSGGLLAVTLAAEAQETTKVHRIGVLSPPSPAHVKAFDFVRIQEPSAKPHSEGVIEIRGPYYTPVTYSYLRGLLEDWGEYVDGYKFAKVAKTAKDAGLLLARGADIILTWISPSKIAKLITHFDQAIKEAENLEKGNRATITKTLNEKIGTLLRERKLLYGGT